MGAVVAALEKRPDICLLDIHMPGNGIVAAKEIRSALPACAIVMLTVSRNDDDLFAALRAGAQGYLLKDTDPGRLSHALDGILAGEAALPRTLVARVLEEFRGRASRRRRPIRQGGQELTTREWEVLEPWATGAPPPRSPSGSSSHASRFAPTLPRFSASSRSPTGRLLFRCFNTRRTESDNIRRAGGST